MRKFRIHFTINDTEDYFIVSGETIEEVRIKTKVETKKRGLDQIKNNIYSQDVSMQM